MIALAGALVSLLILVSVFWMLLTRRLREKYAVLWIIIAVAMLVIALFPGLLEGITTALGVQLPVNLLFALMIALLLGVTLHLSVEVTQAESEIRRLAEDVAILRAEVAEAAGLSAPRHAPEPGVPDEAPASTSGDDVPEQPAD